MTRAQNILEFLRFSEKLKTELRDIKLPGWRMESVAEHTWQLSLLILLVAPCLERRIDLLKALKMAIIHDLAEAETGDIPYVDSIKNPNLKAEKQKEERRAIERITEKIGDPLGSELLWLWNEYEERDSHEAKFVKALDCLEANYQALSFGDIDWWDPEYYGVILTKSDKHCAHEAILREINGEITGMTEDKLRRIGISVENAKSNSHLKRHGDCFPFDSQTMLEYEDFMRAYDREPLPRPLVRALVLRDVLDNAACEAIVWLGESGDSDAYALLEELETQVGNANLQKWIRVARVRCGGYLEGEMLPTRNDDEGDDENDVFDEAMIFTPLGAFEGLPRYLVGFAIADPVGFEKKYDRDTIDTMFRFYDLEARIESFESDGRHALVSMGIGLNHAAADPIERLIEYFNAGSKTVFHKFYCTNTGKASWSEWTKLLDDAPEKI